MSGEIQVKFQPQYSHSVKIEQTAKGARISVHIYSNNQASAINEAVDMYSLVKKKLEQEGHIVAPIETETRPESSLAAEQI